MGWGGVIVAGGQPPRVYAALDGRNLRVFDRTT